MSRVFKKRHIDHTDEIKVYLSLNLSALVKIDTIGYISGTRYL